MRHTGQRDFRWPTLWIVLSLLSACSQPMSDEARLRRAVADMEKAAEARQSGPILDYLDQDFKGNGVYQKANMQAIIRLYFSQNPQVQVFLYITRIEVEAGTAQLDAKVLLAGRRQHVWPEHARALVLNSQWNKHDGKWRVVRARWRDPRYQP